MWLTTKDGRQVNTDWFDEEERKKYAQIEENQKQADTLNGKLSYGPQKFKIIKSRFGNTEYESELFKISKWSKNTSGTSWKNSGYRLEIKGQWNGRGVAQDFDTLKEAKSWLETDAAKEWYRTNKKKNG